MNIIHDIRLYRSSMEHSHLSFARKPLNAAIHRIVMKLREHGFSLGEFDHLYVNFTLRPVEKGMAPAGLPADRYHPWYRYYDIQVSQEQFDRLTAETAIPEIAAMLEGLLTRFFASEEFSREKISACIQTAISQGEEMRMPYKEKRSTSRRAVIDLRFLDSCRYVPRLRVFDLEGNLLLETELPEMSELLSLGEIQLSSKKVTIKPRKNAYTAGLSPVTFEIPQRRNPKC